MSRAARRAHSPPAIHRVHCQSPTSRSRLPSLGSLWRRAGATALERRRVAPWGHRKTWSMDLVDRLVARAQRASPLRVGSFSDLAAKARDAQWIDQNVNGSSDQDARFPTELLLRALHSADFIVTAVELHGSLLEFFAGTSRDILVYDCLHFSVHALSDVLRQNVPSEKIRELSQFRDVACLTASILGSQHLGDFDFEIALPRSRAALSALCGQTARNDRLFD